MKTQLIILSLVLQIALHLNSNAQVGGFVSMDESMQQLLSFYNTDTIIVVIPNGYEVKQNDKNSIESFAFWRENLVYIYKHESALHAEDMAKHLQLFGPAFLFETDIIAGSPIKVEKNGFSYQGRKLKKPNDSFYYMNNEATRIYTCRNGDDFPLVYNEYLAGGVYQLYVFNGSSITLSGFDKGAGSTPNINDMEKLRAEYFCQTISSQFFDLHFACSYSAINSDSLARELDKFVTDFCHFLEVDTSGIPKVTTFIYSNREDLQLFIAANSNQTVYGKSFGNTNHNMHFDLGIFKHEAGHSIIGSKVGRNPNPFFDEGFRQYTDYFFSSEAYENDLKIFKKNADLLTPELVLSTNNIFFSKMLNYSISGVFVKYLIDRIGLEEFKSAYAQNNINETMQDNGFSLEYIVDEFKRLYGSSNRIK
jgi:hypothetical protein